jgi:hypothetical protein
LKHIPASDKLQTIGEYAFCNCVKMNELNIPSTVFKIEEGAFYLCVFLKNITIPDSVLEIEKNAFSQCSNLKEITINNPELITRDVLGTNYDSVVRWPSNDKTTFLYETNKAGVDYDNR